MKKHNLAGYNEPNRIFTETDWANLNGKNVHPYHQSKTLAERSAWDFIESHPGGDFLH